MIQQTHEKVLQSLRTCRTPDQRAAAERYAKLWIKRLQETADELRLHQTDAAKLIEEVRKEAGL